jgi:hypothetical protein
VDHLARPVTWQRTGALVFVYAARVDDTWWVLRLNGFPDHPLFTLFVGGGVVGDVQDLQIHAPSWNLDTDDRPWLTDPDRDEVLTLMRGLGPYGSEAGRPCDGDWCPCPNLTDEYIRERSPAG